MHLQPRKDVFSIHHEQSIDYLLPGGDGADVVEERLGFREVNSPLPQPGELYAPEKHVVILARGDFVCVSD